jgi:hypothetical protein
MNIFKQGLKKRTPAGRKNNSALFRTVGTGLLVLLFGVLNLSAEEIDRLLVAVNGTVITEGDLYITRNLRKLMAYGEPMDSVPPEEELNRFIDLELIRQEMRNLNVATEDEESVDAMMKELRDRYDGEEGLLRQLEKIGIQESELVSFLRLEFSIWKFVEFRFQPFAPGVSSKDIEDYYNKTYVPQLRELGLEIPTLEAVSAEIEGILVEEQINTDLNQWIQDTRRNSRIEYFNDYGPDVPGHENSREQTQGGEAP